MTKVIRFPLERALNTQLPTTLKKASAHLEKSKVCCTAFDFYAGNRCKNMVLRGEYNCGEDHGHPCVNMGPKPVRQVVALCSSSTLDEIKARLTQSTQSFEEIIVREGAGFPSMTLLSIESVRNAPEDSPRIVMTFLANGSFEGVTISRKFK